MKWKTKGGKLLEVKDMTDQHVLNTQRYMKRRVDAMAENTVACASMTFQGEMAQYCQEQELDALSELDMQAIDVLRHFEEEIKQRGLKLLK